MSRPRAGNFDREQQWANREVALGALSVSRALPIKERRLVGPWCFLDRFGPLTFNAGKPMDVAPHPHIGLQTVTWLVQGEVLHNDSLGYEAVLRRSTASMSSRGGCRLLLIGGPPFPEQILMWWNFVARTQDEIAQARTDWEDRERFGDVTAYKGPRLSAPSLVRFARPNPVS